MTAELHFASLLEVSHLIKSRQVSAVQVTRGLLERIERLDGRLHSFVRTLPERALAEAEDADREIAAGLWRGPLHGVPLGLKDLLFMKGLPTGAGMTIHKDFRPEFDATVVTRLKRAGAVIIGKLHMTEGATGDHHPAFAQPDNPWLAGHWTGVSSSGSGVAPAAGFCYGSLGTDTGGSIRMPSAACGLSGIKPTWGRVSRHGLFHLAESMDHIGPMARTTADAAAILKVIAGADPDDPTALQDSAPDYLGQIGGGVEGLVIGVDWDWATQTVHPQMQAAFAASIATLEGLGARIRPVTFPPHPTPEAMPLLLAEVLAVHEETFPSRADEYGPSLRGMLEGGGQMTALMVLKAAKARRRFNGQLARLFEDIDMLATPTLPGPAPSWEEIDVIRQDMTAMIMDLMRYTVPFDLSGSPTLSVPCGFDDKGLPLSLQLIGRHLAEGVLCRAGHAYQSATDFHTRHPALA